MDEVSDYSSSDTKLEKTPKVYQQRFRKKWKTHPLLKDWLREEMSDAGKAYCRFCKCNLLAKFNDLLSHARTKKHQKSAEGFVRVKEDLQEYVVETNEATSKSYEKAGTLDHTSVLDDVSVGATTATLDYEEDSQHLDDYTEEVESGYVPSTSKQSLLQNEHSRAHTIYYKAKSDYYDKLADLSQIHKTLMVLKARKLQLEIERLREE